MATVTQIKRKTRTRKTVKRISNAPRKRRTQKA